MLFQDSLEGAGIFSPLPQYPDTPAPKQVTDPGLIVQKNSANLLTLTV